jgi:toxin-antitoxin system PIN domain toxin
VNVWIALTLQSHVHHAVAARWFGGLRTDSRLCFCRITQLSLLRLLTTRAVMGPEVMSQTDAWQVYDRWLEDGRVVFLDEPAGLELALRAHSRRKDPAPRDWADSYLIAFASVSGLTLVTFDQALQNEAGNVLILTT